MRNNSRNGSEAVTGMMTMGLDLGDQHSYYYRLDEEGQHVESGRVKTSREAMAKRLGGGEPMRVVIEAGTHSPWVSRLLTGWGHEVIVANPRKVRLISDNDGKDDRVDAELLARLGRTDVAWLSPIEHRGAAAQADLAVIRARDALVAARTQLVNHVRGAVKSLGSRGLGWRSVRREAFPLRRAIRCRRRCERRWSRCWK